MTSEVTTQDLQYEVVYEKPTITIKNYDQLVALADDAVAKYSNMVVTEETVKEAKASRAELNKLSKALNDRRIEIGKDYKQPFDEFKAQVDAIIAKIKFVSTPIDDAIKKLDEQEVSKRQTYMTTTLEEYLPAYNLTAEEVPWQIEHPEWVTNGTFWTKAGKPAQKLIRAIGEFLNTINAHKERVNSDKAAAEAYAQAHDLEPDGWVKMVDDGKSFTEVRMAIDDVLMKRKAEADAAAKRAEAQAAIDALSQQQVGDKTIDVETGEVVQAPEQLDLVSAEQTAPVATGERRFTRAFEVTGTEKQLWELAKYMKAVGIDYRSITEELRHE